MKISRLRKITQEELKKILEQHQLWLDSDGIDGHQANLSYTDLEYADLNGANLEYADLEGANLENADLKNANLRGANLVDAKLTNAILRGANLIDSNLIGVDLRNADLYEANLKYANVSYANLTNANITSANLYNAYLNDANLTNANITSANLYGADLCGTNLTNIKYDSTTKFFSLACPEQGEFIGYKKAWGRTPDGYHTEVIVELLILSDAKRSSATTSKCRCNKAKVLSITDLDGKDIGIIKAFSDYDNSFIYKVGETVEVDNFYENRWEECAPGIHFFMDRDMAVEYFL